MNAWRLWQIDQNLDFASHFAACDGLPTEAEAANCVILVTVQYLNEPSWIARMFLFLLLEAVVIGYATAWLAGRERAIATAMTALLCGLAILSFFPNAQIAALAASCGLVLGGLLRHARLKRQANN